MVQGLAINIMGVRSRPIEQKRPIRFGLWLTITAAVMAGAFATLGIGAYSSGMIGSSSPAEESPSTQAEASRETG